MTTAQTPLHPLKGLAVQIAVALAAVGGADVFLGRYGPGHFIPEQKLAAASSAPSPAVVITGDSRMVAATDFGVLREGLDRGGVALPLDDLTLGAVDVTGQSVALRALRARKPSPACVVMGVVGDSLLEPAEVLEPDTLVGNQAVVSVLSKAGDVFEHYPGFPLRHLDPGLRFSLSRLCALGAYKSLLWMKVRVFQDRVVGRVGAGSAVNEFGLVGDMADFAAALRARADDRLRAARNPVRDGWRLNPWFARLRESLRRDGVPLVLVELPMPEAYREGVTLTPAGLALKRWLALLASDSGGVYIDLSDGQALGLTEADFPDRLHMSPTAAKLVSAALAERLAAFLGRRSGATGVP
jgi:hypothetical protein